MASMKPLPISFPLSAATMSDLFFNHRHEQRDAVYNRPDNEEVTTEEIDAALKADAVEFVSCFGFEGLTIDERDALIDWCVEDFNNRV